MRHVRFPAFLILASLMLPPAALAQCPDIPNAANTTAPSVIRLVAADASGTPDPGAGLNLVLRDACFEPIAFRDVRFVVGSCAGVQLSPSQAPGVTANCATNEIVATTDAAGVISVHFAGSLASRVGGIGPTACGQIYAKNLTGESPEWVLISQPRVAVYDHDGKDGLNAVDFERVSCDRLDVIVNGPGFYRQRSDFDGNGALTPADLSLWAQRHFAGLQVETPPRCDAQSTTTTLVAGQGSLNLRWGDCGGAGSPEIGFSCLTNVGTDALVASLVAPPGVTNLRAFEAVIEIATSVGTTLPDWWRFDTCRPGGLTAVEFMTQGACPDLGTPPAFISQPQTVPGSPHLARFRVLGNLQGAAAALTPGTEYGIFQLNLNHSRTVGAGACSGCSAPVSLRFESLRLYQQDCVSAPTSPAMHIDTPDYSNIVAYQGEPAASLQVLKMRAIQAGNTATGTFVVHGTGFQAGTTFKLRRSGQPDILGMLVEAVTSAFSTVVSFDLTGAALGAWDLTATNPDLSTHTRAAALTVVPSVEPKLAAQQSGLAVQRNGRPITIHINTRNVGNLDWTGDAFIAIYVANEIGSVSMKYGTDALGTFTPQPQGSRSLVGTFSLPSHWTYGSARSYSATFLGPDNACRDFEVELFQVLPEFSGPPMQPEAPAAILLEVVRDGAEAQGFTWPALSAPFLGSFRTALQGALLSRIAAFSLDPGSNLALTERSTLIRQSVDAALASVAGDYPTDVSNYRSIWDPLSTDSGNWATFASALPGLSAQAVPPGPANDYPSPVALHRTCYVASLDPNDKSGVSGQGASHYFNSAAPFPYLVHFENLESATAAAQIVTVTDQLDPSKVDLQSFSLGRITFGPHEITPPPGLTSFQADVDLRPGVDVIARVIASMSATTGLVTWRFVSLDPATMAPTEDVFAGLLPPNVAPPEGEGSVSFTVSPLPGLPTGTEIHNQARIVFDENPFIDTNDWVNTVDVTAPASAVSALAPTSESTFSVDWSGSDAGSGIYDYSVYVSVDGGPFAPWRLHTTETSGTFVGALPHAYGFYSVARDAVGNVETAPPVADATTQTALPVDPGEIRPLQLALRRAGMNPARGSLSFEVMLPNDHDARLEVMDTGGRRVASRSLGSLGPGRHVVALADARLSAGVYLVRLTQDGRSVRTKEVLLP